MTRYIFLIIVFTILAPLVKSQQNLDFHVQADAGYLGPDHVPFWLRSNQSGSIPSHGAHAGLLAGAKKNYNSDNRFDWGFGLETQFYAGRKSDIYLSEAYGKVKYGIIQLKAGRSKGITGLCDTTLSSGSWSISGNAPGIPAVELSISEFYTLPFLGQLFAFKGNYLHGWMGEWYIDGDYVSGTRSFLHQKSLYGRFGKEHWKLKLYGGFNHQVTWGKEKSIFGDDFNLTSFESFAYVNLGKQFTYDSIARTRVGNHLGSIDIGMTYEFKNSSLFIYRQNLYDAGALYSGANLLDGLNGISLKNKRDNGRKIQWKKLLIEFLYTRNQAGETWSKHTTTPFEDYYNNFFYKAGWSYKGYSLGNPFITTSDNMRPLPENQEYYFSNNRVSVIHFGLDFNFFGWDITSFLSYSRNYGTYYTSPDGKIYHGDNIEALYGIFPATEQYSAYLKCSRPLKHNFRFNLSAAFDYGDLYYNSVGLKVGIYKAF